MRQYIHTDFLFTISGILILFCSLLFFHSTFDIPIHDTYFVISQTHIAIALCALFMFFALVYFSFKKANRPLYKRLGATHFILTILPILTVSIIQLLPSRHRVYQNMSEEMDNAAKFNVIISISILLCLIGQLLLLVNIVATLIRKNASR